MKLLRFWIGVAVSVAAVLLVLLVPGFSDGIETVLFNFMTGYY